MGNSGDAGCVSRAVKGYVSSQFCQGLPAPWATPQRVSQVAKRLSQVAMSTLSACETMSE